ncbi:hypothetical protein HUU05_02050 [candidate division KSB1 bacterium]|nr:hypothetical protein [candidate division KSB1 bacterium]
MEAIRLQRALKKDGEIVLTGLPYKKGQFVEMILMIEPLAAKKRHRLTARQLIHSDLVGLWENRKDIEDSAAYARRLREQAQHRQR